MNQEDIIIYEQLRDKRFSQNCEDQAIGMLRACEKYLLSKNFTLKHSLLRLVIRPLFYINCMTADFVVNFIIVNRERFGDFQKLRMFIEDHADMVSDIIDELMLCCDFYDMHYHSEKNVVTLNDEVFHNIKDFQDYFIEYFRRHHHILEEEINRIFIEENYEEYFSEIK